MPAPKIRKQRVAIALEEQERLKQQTDEARRAQAIELLKQNQKQKQVEKVEETTPKVKVVKSAQKKTKTTKSSSKKRRTK